MTQEQVESQLSAMFDGELPVAECELLSRRLDRDENLRLRWSRYALIGAAMRSEPVATARHGFAGRVSAALQAGEGANEGENKSRNARSASVARRRTIWSAALAASMVAAVAGISISVLRYSSPNVSTATLASRASAPAPARLDAAMPVAMRVPQSQSHSYTTPINQSNPDIGLRTELADFIVAHSEYSTPLMRRSLLSALVSSEEGVDSSAGPIDASSAASPARH